MLYVSFVSDTWSKRVSFNFYIYDISLASALTRSFTSGWANGNSHCLCYLAPQYVAALIFTNYDRAKWNNLSMDQREHFPWHQTGALTRRPPCRKSPNPLVGMFTVTVSTGV